MDTWYPPPKYATGIIIVNKAGMMLNKYLISIIYVIMFHFANAWHTLCSYRMAKR
jgi:hypothetical protein